MLRALAAGVILALVPSLSVAGLDHEGHDHASDGEALLDAAEAPRAVRRALFKAQAQRERGNPDDAAATLRMALEKGNDHYLLRYQLGNLLGNAGAFDSAAVHLRAAVGAEPRLYPAWRNLAEVAYTLEEYARAATAFREAHERDPDHDPEALFYAAAAHLMAGHPGEALPLCQELVSGAWANLQLPWFRALLSTALALDKPEQADDAMRRVVIVFPSSREAWRLASQHAVAAGDYLRAAAHLTVAGYLGALSADEQRQLGDLLSAGGIPAAAAERYAQVCAGAEAPSATDWERLVASHLAAKDPRAALSALAAALEQHPVARLWLLKGEILFDAGDYAGAKEAFGRAAQLDPDLGRTHLMLGYCALESDQDQDPESHFERAAQDPRYAEQARAALMWLDQLAARAPVSEDTAP